MAERPRNIDFKYNIKQYWDIARKYKLLFIGVLISILIVEATSTLDKFLFKIMIDEGTKFAENPAFKAGFIEVLGIIVVVMHFLGGAI